MATIPDSLQLLFEAPIEDEGDRYVVSVPKELVDGGSLSAEELYRVALLEGTATAEETTTADAETTSRSTESAESASESGADGRENGESRSDGPSSNGGRPGPPVEEGERRTVSIDTLGDQGDGIAKVERGFIVIVSETKPGDRVEVEITDVKDTVAFAEPVGEATVR